MIHSFRRHGARPAARSTGDTKMRKNGTGLSSHRAALRQTHPLAPSSCAPPPARRPGTDSSSLSLGTCGTNKERGWPKGRGTPGAACGRCGGNPAAGKERGAPRWGGRERGEEGRGPRGGDSAPPPPGGELGGPRGSGAPEGRGSAPPTRPRRAPSGRLPAPGSLPRGGSYLGAPGSPFRHRELRGCREPRPPLAPPPRPLPVAAARGGGSRAGAGGGGRGVREEAGEERGEPGRPAPPVLCGPGLGSRASYVRRPGVHPPSPQGALRLCLCPSTRPAASLASPPPHRRPHMPHPRELKAGRLLHVLFNIANIYGALCKYQALSRGLGLQRRPRQTTWI